MKVIYVAGAYRSSLGMWGVRENIHAAMRVARSIWEMGHAAICPHGNTAYMDGGDIPAQMFLDGDLEIVRRCDAVFMLEGWRESQGAVGEYRFALEHEIPTFEDLMQLRLWLEESDGSVKQT